MTGHIAFAYLGWFVPLWGAAPTRCMTEIFQIPLPVVRIYAPHGSVAFATSSWGFGGSCCSKNEQLPMMEFTRMMINSGRFETKLRD
ncbi:hypothetical protein BJ742DRAFT_173094 [Cladochytrium replicatum]|nr:hypothetical protein BJ742DRAFT_173094 [Cladochytrium replicatum]